MATLRELAANLPALHLAAGDTVCHAGDAGGSLWILESGSLAVVKDGVPISTIDAPGAVIGEIAVLTGGVTSAGVTATTAAVVRHAADGAAFLGEHPEALAEIATALARRLQVTTAYLADLTNQYGDAPGLTMVGDVMRRLASEQRPPARPGSARDPDPEY